MMHVYQDQIYVIVTFDQLIKYTGMSMIITYIKKKMKYFMMTTMNYPV